MEAQEQAASNGQRCRLCLDHIKHLLPIFGQVGRDRNIVHLLHTHLHLPVQEEEPLPNHICLECLETVEAFETFYANVAQNQSLLLQHGRPLAGQLHERKEQQQLELDDGDDAMHEDEEPIDDPVDSNDRFLVHCESDENHHLPSPPSYDEAQQNKRANLTWLSVELVDDHCYIDKGTEESKPSNVETSVQEAEPDGIGETERDFDNTTVPTDDAMEPGILVKVSKFKYPKLIRDGKMIVRGELLDKCLEKFYGLNCHMCNDGTAPAAATMEALSEHYRTLHDTERYVVCCGRKIVKRSLMTMHMAKHLEPECFECPHCKKMMTSPRILQLHIRNHLPEAQRPLECGLCPRRFSYVSGLLAHAASHKTEEDQSNRSFHFCNTCGRAYRSRARLKEHILASHLEGDSGSASARCDLCGKQFSSKSNLSYHMATHEPTKHQEQCKHCGKWLKNKFCLRKHMQQHSDMRYHCSKCDYSTSYGDRMQSHLRVQHTDEKPYLCPECGKAFKLRCNLRSHMPQHTGERKYTCEFCARQFLSGSNYYTHRKRMHYEEMERKRKQKELKDRESRIKLNNQ